VDAGERILAVPPNLLPTGVVLADSSAEERRGFQEGLRERFVEVDAGTKNLSLLNIDPPVLCARELLASSDCRRLVAAVQAREETLLAASRQGGSGARSGRTSSSAVLSSGVLAEDAELRSAAAPLFNAIARVFPTAGVSAPATGESFTKPSPGEFALEVPQVALYRAGEHFKAHEDAFPAAEAVAKGYQRRATFLVYLNDVEEGGETQFEHCGPLSVAPEEGKALIFFPSSSTNRPDARTLHSALDAAPGHDKWIAQVWISHGLATAAPAPARNSANAAQASKQAKAKPVRERRKRQAKQKNQAGSSGTSQKRGFGAQ